MRKALKKTKLPNSNITRKEVRITKILQSNSELTKGNAKPIIDQLEYSEKNGQTSWS